MGSINTHRELIARLSKAAQARILALDYRLASEHPFPAPVEDATAAYRWMLAQGLKPFTDRGCRRLRGWLSTKHLARQSQLPGEVVK